MYYILYIYLPLEQEGIAEYDHNHHDVNARTTKKNIIIVHQFMINI